MAGISDSARPQDDFQTESSRNEAKECLNNLLMNRRTSLVGNLSRAERSLMIERGQLNSAY